MTRPHLPQEAETSFEKISISSPHLGHFFTVRVGVRMFADPGHLSMSRKVSGTSYHFGHSLIMVSIILNLVTAERE